MLATPVDTFRDQHINMGMPPSLQPILLSQFTTIHNSLNTVDKQTSHTKATLQSQSTSSLKTKF